MPELRKDPIIGRWVIIATDRAERPDQFISKPGGTPPEKPCPFCEGAESQTPKEVYALRPHNTQPNSPGWDLRVVPSIAPFLKIEGDLDRRGKGLYDIMNGVGAHEIVVETNQHIANMADLSDKQIAKVLKCYADRIIDLEKDKRFKYVLVFKNYGKSAGGGSIRHSRSQLIATPVNPKRVKEELTGSRRYFDYHERCIFCDLIHQEIKQKDRLILDLDGFIAISPFAARFPFETWILPKKHCCDFTSQDSESFKNLGKVLKTVLSKLKKGLNDPPFNYIIHTAPFRRAKIGYWKTIDQDYHWHIEIMPRLTRVAGFEWGTGFYICPIIPEDAAKFLRETEV
ncbi:MAG: galactose-1-phosphate uridylyltransferase [Candidatus Omnitrophica bacterium CG08_land_8_20_14_0_20_41_16]|uniref:Galactose-1-phosphate uridylyltransferase n=1 Tax=Candidatus Sherwoodlollariibacterium unditelluris TaxID=1974757 RepID=A0A2G9YKW9_9BACT|nr:MAG: galactose-1-phosphate uridylyltransferase [Candidatus Omnitrophica bacterium CG23_combo_of_CG06-09_8_20_14_all_41_10]PIS33468.1 MAG: galactose-1-phosphate uridylyltransferase [Candidatus Omnitrophica bacterium CG08_land_8_20_14_0_20_41_16]